MTILLNYNTQILGTLVNRIFYSFVWVVDAKELAFRLFKRNDWFKYRWAIFSLQHPKNPNNPNVRNETNLVTTVPLSLHSHQDCTSWYFCFNYLKYYVLDCRHKFCIQAKPLPMNENWSKLWIFTKTEWRQIRFWDFTNMRWKQSF